MPDLPGGGATLFLAGEDHAYYYEILVKQFIHRFNSTEKELLDELNIERSVFYDRKREALFLFSVCLFGYAVPELQDEMEVPRLIPD